MNNIIAISKIRLKHILQNRSAFFSSLIFEAIYLFLPASVWILVLNQKTHFDYSLSKMISYYFSYYLAQIFIVWTHAVDFGQKVENGSLNYQLVQPITIYQMLIGSWLGTLLIRLVFSILPVLLVISIFFKYIEVKFSILSIFIMLQSSIVFLMFGFVISLLSFLFKDIHFVVHLMKACLLLFGGGLVPLDLLFDGDKIQFFNVFAYGGYYSSQSLIGLLTPTEMIQIIQLSFVWIITFLAIYTLLIRKMMKMYEGVGG